MGVFVVSVYSMIAYNKTHLEHVIDDVEEFHSLRPGRSGADGGVETIVIPDGDNLLKHQSQEKTRSEREGNVVEEKGPFELLRRNLETLHDFTTSKDCR